MDERAQSFSPFYNQPESPKIYLPKHAGPSSSGLTLVIPSLKSLKSASKQKHRSSSHPYSASVFPDVEPQEKKIPRPVKLKPLKEVLSKLIAQLKKKDDYAFFLHPVDAANVPGYSDVVKRPMDLGTMSDKVHRGKYRSLEDFASDFRLVTNNAKLFNPPGTIYHTEADRLEIWGLDHISKAASTVIQYETDWNIEIEKDDEIPVNVDEDEEDTQMEVDTTRERSVSVVSQPPQGATAASSRRGPRGPYRKQGQNGQAGIISESLEPNGGLPGSKDGLGSFPSGSDWAKTMVALKLKGKRYKTKKERLRFEREGPPFLADGSLDYTEMEDPFSVLSHFVPDPPSRPQLVPLYPPLHNPSPLPSQPESSTSYTPQTQVSSTPATVTQPSPPIFPSTISVSLDHPPLTLPFLNDNAANDTSGKPSCRRHWTIVRNASSRHKGKEREDELHESLTADLPAWQMPREPHAVDYGSFSVLAGALSEELRKSASGGGGGVMNPNPTLSNDEEASMELVRASLNCENVVQNNSVESLASPTNSTDMLTAGYFTPQRAAEAEGYIRDLVYGGLDGLAYVRSLAEFVDGNTYYKEEEEDAKLDQPYNPVLGMSLSKWVETNVVDPLTDGRHSLLREAGVELFRQKDRKASDMPPEGKVASQVAASLHQYPLALAAMTALLQIRLHKIDMGSLIKMPNELFLSEEEWAGKSFKEKRKERTNATVGSEPTSPSRPEDAMEVEEPEQTWAGVDASLVKDRANGRLSSYEQEGPEELNEVLDYVAKAIMELDQWNRTKRNVATKPGSKSGLTNGTSDVHKSPSNANAEVQMEDATTNGVKEEPDTAEPFAVDPEASTEDPKIRNLRLNLLALAKRAPLDTIARLPKDLVPEHIRHFVPTLGSSG